MLLPHMVCNALVAGGRLLGAEQQAVRPGEESCATESRTTFLRNVQVGITKKK